MEKEKISEEIICSKDSEGKRIDTEIPSLLHSISRSAFQKLVKEGCVMVNEEICKDKKTKLTEGDKVSILTSEKKMPKAEDICLDVIYQDHSIAVINKPKGMLVHPAGDVVEGTLVNAILYRYGNIPGTEEFRPGIVHRIDKDTSGLIVIAKTQKALDFMVEQFASHKIKRRYVALVRGIPELESGIINEPIGRNKRNRYKRQVNGEAAKKAVTGYRVKEKYNGYSLIQAELKTGRTHQIRVHMEYINHPLPGDWLYTGTFGEKNRYIDLNGKKLSLESQLLHAEFLGFNHPETGEYLEFKQDIPEEFKEILDIIKKEA